MIYKKNKHIDYGIQLLGGRYVNIKELKKTPLTFENIFLYNFILQIRCD